MLLEASFDKRCSKTSDVNWFSLFDGFIVILKLKTDKLWI